MCVCLVTTITKKIVYGFVPNFMGRFVGGKEDQVRVSLRSVEGFVSNGQNNSVNRRLFTKTGYCLQNCPVGKFGTSGLQNSWCGKCCQVLATKTLSQGFVLSQITFRLVYNTLDASRSSSATAEIRFRVVAAA